MKQVKTKLIDRVLNTSDNAMLKSFINKALSEPLLAHDEFLNLYMRTVLRSGIEFKDMDDNLEHNSSVPVIYHPESRTLQINIDGALVNREMSVPCAVSPVSYQAIRHELAIAMERVDVDNIVARISSGGGVAARNSDISDYIYSLRGKGKRLIAVADDAAYSAAFSIYSAFEERYVSRSGGLGSVGV